MKQKNNRLFLILIIQFLMLFFLPAMGGDAPLARESGNLALIYKVVIYFIYASLSVGFVIQFALLKRLKLEKYVWWLFAFGLICVIGAAWGLFRGQPLTDVIRGLLPFVWYSYILIIVQELDNKVDDILFLLSGITIAYVVRLLLYYFIYCFGKPYMRVSYYFTKANSFMVVLGVIFFSYMFIMDVAKKKLTITGIVLCQIGVVLTNSRAILLAALAGVFLFWLAMVVSCVIEKNTDHHTKSLLRKRGCIVLIIVGVIVCVSFLTQTDILRRWKEVFDFVGRDEISVSVEKTEHDKIENGIEEGIQEHYVIPGNINARFVEYRVAYDCWKESPILGQGIGYRWSDENIDSNENVDINDKLDYGAPRLYMHNVIAYVLMDFGIIGILYLIVLLIALVIMAFKVLGMREIQTKKKLIFFFFLSALAAAFVYSNFSAIFRDIEFVLLCAFLISGAVVKYLELNKEMIDIREKLS